MDSPSSYIIPPGVDHGLLPPGLGKRRLLIRDLIAHHGKGLVVTVHPMMPGIRDDLRLSGMNALLYDLHAKPEQRLEEVESFEKAQTGALITSMGGAAKLSVKVPLLVFADCSISLRSKHFLDVVQNSGAGQIHYVNCHYVRDAYSSLDLPGVQKGAMQLPKSRH